MIGHPALEYLQANGAEVMNRTSVDSLAPLDEGDFEVQLSNGPTPESQHGHIRVGTQRAKGCIAAIRCTMRQTGIATRKVPAFTHRRGSSLVSSDR